MPTKPVKSRRRSNGPKKEKYRMILSGGQDAWKLADWLGERKIPVVYLHMFTAPRFRNSPHDEQFRAPGILAKAGVPLSIGFRLGDGPRLTSATYLITLPMQSLTVCRGKSPGLHHNRTGKTRRSIQASRHSRSRKGSNFHRHHGGLARPSLLRQTHGHCREKNKPAKPAHPFIRKIP